MTRDIQGRRSLLTSFLAFAGMLTFRSASSQQIVSVEPAAVIRLKLTAKQRATLIAAIKESYRGGKYSDPIVIEGRIG